MDHRGATLVPSVIPLPVQFISPGSDNTDDYTLIPVTAVRSLTKNMNNKNEFYLKRKRKKMEEHIDTLCEWRALMK